MKERKCESLFSFRRSNNRYSLHLEKSNKKEADVQLKRASWSSFPLLKFSSFDERGSREDLGARSQSTEDVKQHHIINTPKVGCNFLRSSTASIRSAFSHSSSSSSSSPSSSSSRSIQSSSSSGKSSITSILEGSVTDSHYDSCSTVEENPPHHYYPAEGHRHNHLLRSSSDVIPHLTPNYAPLETERETSSVPSLYRHEGRMSPTSPKIVFAHKKTPDVRRKSRKQLVQEYELMKESGSLPHNVELIQSEKDGEKENVVPRPKPLKPQGKPKTNFKFMQSYKFLSKVDSKHSKRSFENKSCDKSKVNESDAGEDVQVRITPDNANVHLSQDVMPFSDNNHLEEDRHLSPSPAVPPSVSPSFSPSSYSPSFSITSPSAPYGVLPFSVSSFLNTQFTHLLNEEEPDPPVFGVITDIIEEEENSECDADELLTLGEESSSFEKHLEDKLEMLGEKEEEPEHEGGALLDYTFNDSPQTKKTELKLTLAKPQHAAVNKVHRARLLRHISEEPDSGGGASGSEDDVELRSPCTPGTPRSPAIDIDDVFKQKQKEIEDGNRDDMSRVKALALRLKLATRRPSYMEWLGTVQQKGLEMNNLLESHTPLVLENGQPEEEPTNEVRKKNLQSAMGWIRQELMDMRQQDQQLARQLMQLRIELQRLRLLRSCNNHQALVDEVTNEAEEARTFESNDLCEVPPGLRETFSPILREIGVTRMNITSRRFSLR